MLHNALAGLGAEIETTTPKLRLLLLYNSAQQVPVDL